MLIPCPECGKQVSDRAKACVDCGFPVAEHVAERAAARQLEEDRTTRKRQGVTDCVHCEARGFVTVQGEDGERIDSFYWCTACKHTGRVPLFQSARGFWAVDEDHAESFAAGQDVDDEHAKFLGIEAPQGHRFDQAGARHDDE